MRGILRGRTLVLLTIALLIAVVAQRTCGNPDGSYPVVSVVDGDTIKVRMSGRVESVRLIGIDAPETNAPGRPVQCFGPEASAKAKELLAGKAVRLEFETRRKVGAIGTTGCWRSCGWATCSSTSG